MKMAKRKQQTQTFIKGSAKHRRTESDYMSTLLETVTLEDWQEVVASTLAAAKQGDAQARAWLAQYLVGKPVVKAPTPLTVVVQQLNGENPLVNRLAHSVINEYKYPELQKDNALETQIKALVASELAEKVTLYQSDSSPDTPLASATYDGKNTSEFD
jgi:hypothetical protein